MKTNLKTGFALPAFAAAALLLSSLAPASAQTAPESEKVRLKIVKNIDGKTTIVDTTFEKGSPEFEAYQKKLVETHPALKTLPIGETRQFRIISDEKDGKISERQIFVFDTIRATQIRSLNPGKELPADVWEKLEKLRTEGSLKLRTDENGNPVAPQFRESFAPGDLEKLLKEKGLDGSRMFIRYEKTGEAGKPCIFFADSLMGKLNADQITVFKRIEGEGKSLIFVKITEMEKNENALLENQNSKLDAPKKELKVEDFSVYPNPTVGRFTLTFDLEDKGNTSIRIFDEAGRQVYSEELKGFKGGYSKEIDLSGSPKGVYFVRVDQGKKGFSRKIVLQ